MRPERDAGEDVAEDQRLAGAAGDHGEDGRGDDADADREEEILGVATPHRFLSRTSSRGADHG